jgi:hypothetical protein
MTVILMCAHGRTHILEGQERICVPIPADTLRRSRSLARLVIARTSGHQRFFRFASENSVSFLPRSNLFSPPGLDAQTSA